MKKVGFLEWIETKKGTERKILTVPTHIISLPCGCTREKNDIPFQIKKRSDGIWVHHRILSRHNHYVYIVKNKNRLLKKLPNKNKGGSFFVKSSYFI